LDNTISWQPPLQWVPGALPSRSKADHSLSSILEIKNGGAISPLPNTSS
jgi:hypothetical protein